MDSEVCFKALNLDVQVHAPLELFLAFGLCAQSRDLAQDLCGNAKGLAA